MERHYSRDDGDGRPVNPNDMKVIVDYLAKNFGPD